MLSHPWVFSGLRLFNIRSISSSFIFTDTSRPFVLYSNGESTLVLLKDHLISYLICLCTFLWPQRYFWALVWFSGEKVFILFSWIRLISFGQFRPISQGCNNLRIHPVGILIVDFDNLIRNKISKYFSKMLLRLLTFSSVVLLIKTSFQFTILICI